MGSIQKYRNKKKKIFGDFIIQNEESLSIIKRIKTLVYIDPKYVKDIFKLVKKSKYF